MLPIALPALLTLVVSVYAYIPALPTNSTRDAVAGGLNLTEISKLHMRWFSNGSYSQDVSYQLAGYGSTGISKGVLVHFSEERVSNMTPPTLTPWIALVSCDRNATNASMEEDIFTLARDKGAVSAVLYSLSSVACVINPEYSDPATFDQVFDIFSTQSSTSSHLIEYQFGQLGAQNKSIFNYDSQQLNNSAKDVIASMNQNSAVSSGYLLAILQAYNATGDISSTTGASNGPAEPAKSGSPNTALAMIILYAITGCVSALFCIVVISGAIRAVRHPERYGPRARFDNQMGPPQSRARGLTRAILDTFPIVKFGNGQGASHQDSSPPSRVKDPENVDPRTNIELVTLANPMGTASPEVSTTTSSQLSMPPSIGAPPPVDTKASASTDQSASPLSPSGRTLAESQGVVEGSSRGIPVETSKIPDHDDVVPASIGRDTCPICIVNFEEGDDIRVLPCEGKHCFHQQCVDPWLLKLSSSCPICRHDFLALESMLSGRSDGEIDDPDDLDHQLSQPRGHSSGGRFSRYLRFAHHRQRRRRGDDNDPTDPYMPTAPETSLYSGA